MHLTELMTPDPACCTADTDLQTVAQMMVDCDCGAIPIVADMAGKRPVGIVTDRDITIRAVAQGRNPLSLTAGDVMTSELATVRTDESVEELLRQMEANQVRRMLIVDEEGALAGIVAQADVALYGHDEEATAEVVEEISQPTPAASRV